MRRLERFFAAATLALAPVLGSAQTDLAEVRVEVQDDANHVLTIDGSRIEVHFSDESLYPNRDMFLEWISYSAQAVHHYYGRFPVDRVALALLTYNGGGVSGGKQFSGKLPLINVTVGNRSTAAELRNDWIMVHEMIHLALADLPQKNRWLEEGLAVYVESIARAQVGHIDEEFVWRGFLGGMPHGIPKQGDRGLDNTPTWGRTYWGGALFCLLADVEIRERTNNRYSLQHAVRAIVSEGYSSNVDSLVTPVLEVADAAVGVDVLLPMYRKMSVNPEMPALDELWQSLGVSVVDGEIRYDDSAPLAHVREALMKTQAPVS
ncbi:MAG: hypothetical protein AAF434_16590 [Pseudomonadota bacterium]